jgi:drug/metabolite transporter (DMT)-like permease
VVDERADPPPGPSPIARGVVLAGLAAISFGLTAPLLQRASVGVGTLTAGALLYLGAAAVAILGTGARRAGGNRQVGSPLRGRFLARTAVVALLGALAAPALLIAGLRRMDAATGSLLLILEAPLTLVLAHVLFRERLGRRVVAAACLIFAGALLLALRPAIAPGTALGTVLVVGAALCWALDNLLSRPLAEIDPARSVVWKGLLGGGLSAASAVVFGEGRPSLSRAAALLLLGGVGYGVSLRLYLRAQTLVGAARTASVFAAAPFVGAALAVALGSAWPGWQLPVGGGLMLAGVALHLLERHHHRHVHETVAHEHLHTHDDGHHTHAHEPMPSGPHSHPHHHEALMHDHGHSEDLHHRHEH